MKAANVCRMREAFLEECKRHDYVIPSAASRTTVLEGIEKLAEDDVIDKSAVATRTSAIQESLCTTDQQINQLCQQLKGQLFTKGFLIRVLAVLCGDRVVTEAHIADLARQVEEINTALLEVISNDNLRFCSFGQEIKTSQSVRSTLNEQVNEINSNIVKSEVVRSTSAAVKTRAKPVPAARSKCKSSHEISNLSVAIDALPVRPSSETGNSVLTDRTVGSFHSNKDKFSSESGRTEIRDPSSEDTKVCRNLQPTCENPQMNEGPEDEESPYDNVLSLQDYLTSTMFRRKKSNASRADLEHNSLSSKDNFLAVTSKHVAPSEIPRSQESTTQSPHLGRHFQMLKMTTGFDFVLDDNECKTQHSDGGSGANHVNSDNSEAKSDNGIVDSHALRGDISTGVSPNIDEVKNRHSSHNDVRQNVDISNQVSPSPTPQGDADRDKGHEKKYDEGQEEKTVSNLEQKFRASATVINVNHPQGTSGPRNATSSTDSPRLTPSAPPAYEVLPPSTHTEANARANTSQAVRTTAASATAPVAERTPACKDKTFGRSPDGAVTLTASTPTPSTCSSGNMESSHKQTPVPARSAPTPPPVAKKPARYGSGKAAPPVPGVKPALKPSQSAHAQLSNFSAEPKGPSKPDKLEETSASHRDYVNFGLPHSHSSPVASPSLSKSKSPNPVDTAPKPSSGTDGRKGNVNGIAELFGGKTRTQSHKSSQNDSVSASRDDTPPPVHARKRASETINNLRENTHPEENTCDQVGAEVTSSKADNKQDSKCVTEEKGEEEQKLSTIQTAVRHSLLAADAVAWPAGLDHPELKPCSDDEDLDSKTKQDEEGGGLGELIGKSRSSLISIHNRLHRGGTLANDTEPTEENSSTQINTQREEGDIDRDAFDFEEGHTTERMWSQDSVDTIVNSEEDYQDRRLCRDRSVSFTFDKDVKEAVLFLDAILGSEPVDDTLGRNPSVRLSTTSTSSSVASNPRSSSTPSSPVSLRRQHELGVTDASADRRKSSLASYENWTINRAVTRPITSTPDFDYSSEDDNEGVEGEVDDVLSEGVASPCLMKRDGPAKGSKDSGLCDDISLTSESGHVTITAGTGSGTEGGVGVLADGKIRDLDALKLLTERAGEDDDEMKGGDGEGMDTQNKLPHSLKENSGDQDMDSICE